MLKLLHQSVVNFYLTIVFNFFVGIIYLTFNMGICFGKPKKDRFPLYKDFIGEDLHHMGYIYDIAIASVEKYLVTTSENSLIIWDFNAGEIIK